MNSKKRLELLSAVLESQQDIDSEKRRKIIQSAKKGNTGEIDLISGVFVQSIMDEENDLIDIRNIFNEFLENFLRMKKYLTDSAMHGQNELDIAFSELILTETIDENNSTDKMENELNHAIDIFSSSLTVVENFK